MTTLYGDTTASFGTAEIGLPQRLAGGVDQDNLLSGDAYVITGSALGANDRLIAGDAVGSLVPITNTLYGDAQALLSHGHGGNDVLRGGDGALAVNVMMGDAGQFKGYSTGGTDTLIGGAGAVNYLYGDAQTMWEHSRAGNDRLVGGEGGTNFLYGDAAVMMFTTKGGNDTLVSGAHADDHMWGDAVVLSGAAPHGQDRFVFAPGNGADIIHDFRHGEDRIDLRAFADAGIHRVADLAVTYDATGALIDFGDGNSITVVYATDLVRSDFILA